MKLLIHLLLFLAVLSLNACQSSERELQNIDNKSFENKINAWKPFLKTGDIALRRGNDVTSYMLSQFNFKAKLFSHAGIINSTDSGIYVYHIIGGEANPNEEIRYETIDSFWSPISNNVIGYATLSLKAATLERLEDYIQQAISLPVKFDLDFDIQSDERMYCAEFVAKSLNAATLNPNYIPICDTMGRKIYIVDGIIYHPDIDTVVYFEQK